MALLLKDSGLNGRKGSVHYCPDCRRQTAHFRKRGELPVCAICGAIRAIPKIRSLVSEHESRGRYSLPIPLERLRFDRH